jgi:hypothetical protein
MNLYEYPDIVLPILWAIMIIFTFGLLLYIFKKEE